MKAKVNLSSSNRLKLKFILISPHVGKLCKNRWQKTSQTYSRYLGCSWWRQRTLQKYQLPRQRTPCLWGWDEDTCRAERREKREESRSKDLRPEITTTIGQSHRYQVSKTITWAGPAFVRETPRFWWSPSWGRHCRGGKEGLSRGRGLWAQPASWRGRRKDAGEGDETFDLVIPLNSLKHHWFGLLNNKNEFVVSSKKKSASNKAHLVNDFIFGCWFSSEKTQLWEWSPVWRACCVCILNHSIISILSKFPDLICSPCNDPEKHRKIDPIKGGVCLKATLSSLYTLGQKGSSLWPLLHTDWGSTPLDRTGWEMVWFTERNFSNSLSFDVFNRVLCKKSPWPDAQEVFSARGGAPTSSCRRWSLWTWLPSATEPWRASGRRGSCPRSHHRVQPEKRTEDHRALFS